MIYAENHLLHRLARVGDPAKVFATRPDAPDVTYAALFAGAERIAAALAAAGLSKGDRVAVQVTKSLEALQLYLGTVLAGGVFLPLNTGYTEAELRYFFDDAMPRIVVCDPSRADAFGPLAPDATHFTLGADGSGSLIKIAEQQRAFSAVPCAADDLAAILYTSGTTGRSKGAMLSHGNLASNSETLRQVWGFTADDVLIHALPIFHTHGLFVATNVALLSGASVHFLPGFDAGAILVAMPRATALMGVPTFYTRLLEHPDLNRQITAQMRIFISGSAPMLMDTHQRWREVTGHTVIERYGMTETNMNTSNPPSAPRPGTVGLPLPDVDLRIMQADQLVRCGEIGVIEVRGPNVFQGYWQMPEKTAEELRPDGWFITGDQGMQDADGYVTIVGREKDMVITGGFNVYPKEIESLIDELPGVQESAVIGVPHPDFGEAVVALVVSERRVEDAEVTDHLADNLARFKLPKKVIFLPELPRNTMGKVQKKALRDRYSDLFD